MHTKGAGARDFRVILDGVPTGYCFHASCASAVAEFNRELRSRVWKMENGSRMPRNSAWSAGVAAEPKKEEEKRPPVDDYDVWEYTRGVPAITEDWLARRSPRDVSKIGPADFLNALFEPGDRVLVFTAEFSQGDFLHWCGHGSYRLSRDRGVKAVPSALPSGGPRGVWYLVQPVTGQWTINMNKAKAGGSVEYSRRWEGCVTRWKHLVLESDTLAADDWLKVLVSLGLPIAAIYTSGGRSVHAIVRVDVPSKPVWDALRNALRAVACPLGADAGAMSAVRLSRLPGCKRGASEQRLLYLDPSPHGTPIVLQREVR